MSLAVPAHRQIWLKQIALPEGMRRYQLWHLYPIFFIHRACLSPWMALGTKGNLLVLHLTVCLPLFISTGAIRLYLCSPWLRRLTKEGMWNLLLLEVPDSQDNGQRNPPDPPLQGPAGSYKVAGLQLSFACFKGGHGPFWSEQILCFR